MGVAEFSPQSTADHDGRQVRELRLEMMLDTPPACTQTLETGLSYDEVEWRMREPRGINRSNATA